MSDLVERLNEERAHCGMCGENAVERNSRGQFICVACLHETIPDYQYAMRWEAADEIARQQARIAELEAGLTFYADENNYIYRYTLRECGCCSDDEIPVVTDRGQHARALLKGEK